MRTENCFAVLAQKRHSHRPRAVACGHRAALRCGQPTDRWPRSCPRHTTEKANSLHAPHSLCENEGPVASSRTRTERRKQTSSHSADYRQRLAFPVGPSWPGRRRPWRSGWVGASFRLATLASRGSQTATCVGTVGDLEN